MWAAACVLQLRAIAEYYACDDAKGAFVDDFAAAWAKVINVDCYYLLLTYYLLTAYYYKVMNSDRFDL